MPAGLVAGLLAVAGLWRPQGRTGIAFPLPDAAGALLAVAELGNLDLRQGDGNEIVPFLADHLPAADVLAKVAFHLAADNFSEPLLVAVDFLAHGSLRYAASGYRFVLPRAKMLATNCNTSVAQISQ